MTLHALKQTRAGPLVKPHTACGAGVQREAQGLERLRYGLEVLIRCRPAPVSEGVGCLQLCRYWRNQRLPASGVRLLWHNGRSMVC